MTEIISVLAALTCIGLLVYFRMTDARSTTVQSLKDYLHQSEKHIESMLNRKEKEFSDRMIESEIVIERLHRMTSSLQEKLDHYDGDILKGQEIFDDLKNEILSVQEELYEYKKIRSEFRDIEERIAAILDIKQQAEDGTVELRNLREAIARFEQDYEQVTTDTKNQSRQELDSFFHSMQQDLSDYLTKSRQQLTDKDEEMTRQIQELGAASNSMVNQIKEFKDFAGSSIEQLKQECAHDIAVAKSLSDTTITDIYDTWDKLKEKTHQDTNDVLSSFNEHKEFFETAELNLRADIQNFNNEITHVTEKVQTSVEFYLQDRIHEFENKIVDIHNDIETKGISVRDEIGEVISSQTVSVREELDRLRSAFVEQEQSIDDRIRVLSSRVSDGLTHTETAFQNSLSELQESADRTKAYADRLLEEAQMQISQKIVNIEAEFKEIASENMMQLEESFKESNHERLNQSINDTTKALSDDFRERYQQSIEQITNKADELEEHVKDRLSSMHELDKRMADLSNIFDEEKETIILMRNELETDRHNNIAIIFQQVQEYVLELREELTSTVKQFMDDSTQSLVNDQDSWRERYEEVLREGRDENSRIKQDIDNIHRIITDIESSTLGAIKRSVDRLTHETEYRIEDFKKQIGDFSRTTKDEFYNQTTQAQDAIKNLRQELWNQENEMRQLVDKDIDRLGAKGKDIEKQFQVFMKKADKLDQVEDLMRNVTQQQDEYNALRKDFESMNMQLSQSYQKAQETIEQLNVIDGQLADKTDSLNEHSVMADRANENLITAIQEAGNLSHVFENLQTERAKAQEIEDLLQKNLAIFNELQSSLDGLEHNRAVIENLHQALIDSESGLNVLTITSEDINDKINHMGGFAQEIDAKLTALQQEMKSLAGDQTKVRSAVTKITDLEHIVTHIDEEMKRVMSMRDWIAKSMNNIERMGDKLGAGSYSGGSDDNDDANVRSIIKLYEKDWSIDDIAKNLKLTSAYVELIIERYR